MLSLWDDAIRRHRGAGVLVDTNLLLVPLVDAWSREAALAFKRTSAYSPDDLDVLALVLEPFERVIVCGSVIAEVSNLAGQLKDGRRLEFFVFLSERLQSLAFEERPVTIPTAAAASGFVRLGFADATIETLAGAGALVLTDDFPLYVHLVNRGVEVFNFTHLRGLLTL
jgi:hypothetical protein